MLSLHLWMSEDVVSWILLCVLYLFRFLLCFSMGYVHPDEFFQGGQELFYGILTDDTRLANSQYIRPSSWEWERENALRSVVPPTLMTKIPVMLYSLVTKNSLNDNLLSGKEYLFVPRIWTLIVTMLTVDLPFITLISRKHREGSVSMYLPREKRTHAVPGEVLILASSWTTILFFSRPFTNTLETSALAVLLLLVLDQPKVEVSLCAKSPISLVSLQLIQLLKSHLSSQILGLGLLWLA